jgi:hypothetical protein
VNEKTKRANEKEAGGDQSTRGKTRYFFSFELCDTLYLLAAGLVAISPPGSAPDEPDCPAQAEFVICD